MSWIQLCQPYITVDAATGIPARIGLFGIVHTNRQHILHSPLDIGSQVITERDVPVGTCPQFMAIDINGGVHIGTIEIYAIAFALIGLIGSKSLAIPAYTTRQCTSTRSRRIVFTEFSFNGPIVGQVQFPPVCVIIIRTGCRRIVSQAKGPVGSKIQATVIASYLFRSIATGQQGQPDGQRQYDFIHSNKYLKDYRVPIPLSQLFRSREVPGTGEGIVRHRGTTRSVPGRFLSLAPSSIILIIILRFVLFRHTSPLCLSPSNRTVAAGLCLPSPH